jgi:hypothetical protein
LLFLRSLKILIALYPGIPEMITQIKIKKASSPSDKITAITMMDKETIVITLAKMVIHSKFKSDDV